MFHEVLRNNLEPFVAGQNMDIVAKFKLNLGFLIYIQIRRPDSL
ncbi:hypothetical protein [Desulfitobacterium metallireducens]|nr:hypothetical protein [Desulfitobacterium metallireducens]